MRLGGPVFETVTDPETWVRAVKNLGYTAAYCPVDEKQTASVIRDYAAAAGKAGIVIAEVGVWNNPLSQNETARREAIKLCQTRLSLADAIGARCCVNIAGSRGEKWDGPSFGDLTGDAFDLIVESIQKIIDAVKPKQTCYTLETMPWMYPDSIESYLELIDAIDRKQFAVHFDPVNLISSPQRYFNNDLLIAEFVDKLGPHIKSCHAKDVLLQEKFTVHLDEVAPGKGKLNYAVLLKKLNELDDVPVMLEHLAAAEEYAAAADYVRSVARNNGLSLG